MAGMEPAGLTIKDNPLPGKAESVALKKLLSNVEVAVKALNKNTSGSSTLQKQTIDLQKKLVSNVASLSEKSNFVTENVKRLQTARTPKNEVTAFINKESKNLTTISDNVSKTVSSFVRNVDKLSSKSEFAESKKLLTRALNGISSNNAIQKKFFNAKDTKQSSIKRSDAQNFDAFDDTFANSRKEARKEANKKERSEALSSFKNSLIVTAMGPLRMALDPLSELITKKTIYENLQEGTKKAGKSSFNTGWDDFTTDGDDFDFFSDTRSSGSKSHKYSSLYETSPFDIDDYGSAFIDKNLKDSDETKLPPNRGALLAKGGVVGAGSVLVADTIINLLGPLNKKIMKGSVSVSGGLLDSLIGKGAQGRLGNAVKGLGKGAGKALNFLKGPGGLVLAGAAMMTAGGIMQKRDSTDAKEHFKKGDTLRGVETSILGDRSRITKETANSELGRTAAKTGLLVGGAGTAAVGVAGMAGAAAAGGGLLGGGAAAGTAMLAAFPPALITAAVVTAGAVIAKGTQEAFELGWDKNQDAIQEELTKTMLSENSTTSQKLKARVGSVWKGFTGELAGGIREAGKVLDAETEIQNTKQLDYIKQQAESGSKGYSRLMEVMSSEQFKTLSEAEQVVQLKAEGLHDEFLESQKKTQMSIGDKLSGVGKTISGFFSGMNETSIKGERGRQTAMWENSVLKGKDGLSEAEKADLLSKEKELAIARGELRKDGTALLRSDLAGGPRGVKSAEEYKQTFEFSRKKLDLMKKGKTAEDAEATLIAEQNKLYEDGEEYRLKQTREYKDAFKKQLEVEKDTKKAEKAALMLAKESNQTTKSTTDILKDKFKEFGGAIKNIASSIGNFFSGNGGSSSTESINDGIITKDGRVIQLSPDDNVYATKNEPMVVRDKEAQMAMPDVPKASAEFTDANIVAAIQVLTDVLNKKEMSMTTVSSGGSMNFDKFRVADVF